MAKISVVRDGGSYRITLKGRLTASDLRRLERACGNALEHKLAPLELNVEQVLSIGPMFRAKAEYLPETRKHWLFHNPALYEASSSSAALVHVR